MDASSYVELKPNRNIPAFRVGDTVRVHAKVIEGDRQRIQAFEGVVIRVRRGGINSNFTVRRVSHGVGVERVFPYYSPLLDKVEVTRVGRVRRARLYYLRERVGKKARIRAGSRARFEELTARRFTADEEEELPEGEATAEVSAEEPSETANESAAEEPADEVTEPEAVKEAPEPEADASEAAASEGGVEPETADEPEAAEDKS